MKDSVKKYSVSVFGDTYSLVSDEPEQLVIDAAKLVDSSMLEVAQKSQLNDVNRIAVLVAIRMASKLLTNQNQHENANQKLIHQINYITRHLEQIFETSSDSLRHTSSSQ